MRIPWITLFTLSLAGAIIWVATMKTLHTTTIEYKTTAQGTLALDIYLDKTVTGQRPAILFLFGGGWVTGRRQQFTSQAEHFARRGMVSILADYRVSSRHSTTPVDALADARDAFDWIHRHATEFGIDQSRLVIAGGSSGGHLALCTALDCMAPEDSKGPVALILYNPVIDLISASPELGFSEGELTLLDNMLEAEIRALSPFNGDCRSSPPTLLMYGSGDPLLAQAKELLACQINRHASATKIVTWPGANHGFFNNEPWLSETTATADQFLVDLNLLSAPAGNASALEESGRAGQ